MAKKDKSSDSKIPQHKRLAKGEKVGVAAGKSVGYKKGGKVMKKKGKRGC